jgi:spermidine synthase
MPGAELSANFWVSEYMTPHDVYAHGVTAVHAFQRTQYQEMAIVESGTYGKALVLDGKWQSSLGDEFLYHEPLVHVPAIYHALPKRVLILGGAEGGTLREALKWQSVERVVMVDLDGEVVEACKQHLPEMHQQSFDDPRVELIIGDAEQYLRQTREQWDLIISDLTDPLEHGPAFRLFTQAYFQLCRSALAEGGTFTVQAGSLAPAEVGLHARVSHTVASVFPYAASYQSFVPTYGSPHGFVLGSERPVPVPPDMAEVDRLLAERTSGEFRMFDGQSLGGLMLLPRNVRDEIAKQTRPYTLDQPARYFGQAMTEQA